METNDHDIIVSNSGQLSDGTLPRRVPKLFREANQNANRRFVEFFTANIRNRNTREAYARAVYRFADWCELKRLQLHELNPVVVAVYVEQLMGEMSVPSVKQHLAAIRMLFDYLVVGQGMAFNPAASVRGPKHVVYRGKTPVLMPDQARVLLDSIDTSTVGGLRDRALIGTMVFSFARVSAVVGMNAEDYYPDGKRWWIRLYEKNSRFHEVPAHHAAEAYLDEYIVAAGIASDPKGPLFRSLDRHRQLTDRRMHRREVLAMIKRRARDAGLPDRIGCHTFRATGITAYMLNGGTLEDVQSYCLPLSRYTVLRNAWDIAGIAGAIGCQRSAA